MTPGRQRQAEYRARMLAEGKRQYSFWLTDEQVAEIRAYLAGEQSLLTPKQPEKAPKAKPKTKLVKVEPSKPDRLSEYVLWQDDKRLGRVWQVAEKPKWRGFPTGFNARQYSGNSRQAVVERIQQYKSL